MAKHDNADCQGFMVPLTVENVPDVELYGELCVPKGRTPSAVQLLVHGTTYNHNYWDWPEDPDMHSHVRAALAADYATFNVDRLGVGKSTKPASHLVTLAATVDTLHPSHQQAPRWSHRRSPFFQSRLFRQLALDRLWMGRGVVAR